VFGGIVLISCLLAILPRQHMPSPLMPIETASSAMLERRMISARDEIARLQSEIERLSRSTDPRMAEMQARRDSLRRVHERLQADIKGKQERESNDAEARAIVGQGDPEALKERLAELKLQRSKAEGIETAASEKIRFLEKRIASLREEASELENGRTQAVRFPRERLADADPLPIIIRYNAVYPMVIGGDFRNNPAITRTPESDGDGVRVDPVRGEGIRSPDTDEALAATLKIASAKGLYATLYLYPDSHHAFADLREALAKAKLAYGLEFVKAHRELIFSSLGSAPPEL
jgi:FtsZ-binding cell division protein ZapB